MAGRFLSIGECMVERKPTKGDVLHESYAGDTFNAAYYPRLYRIYQRIGPLST